MDIKFYVLIIIAWLIFKVVSAVRKANAANVKNKPNTPAVTSPRNTNARSLEELFSPSGNTQARNNERPQPAAEYGSQEVIIDETLQDSEAIYNRGAYTAYTSQENIVSEEQHYTFESEEEQAKISAQLNDAATVTSDEKPMEFDLKQAIIYSEILRRPHA